MTGLYVASNAKAYGSQIQLQRNISDLGNVLTRLSTGLRINSAKDDPAGLIASELLKSDITATKQAIQNTQRANSVLAVADSALGQISSLLNDVRSLVNASANTISMTSDQLYANQLQIDASIDSIDRIAKTTNFQGEKLLDGSKGFQTTSLSRTGISQLDVQSANFGTASEVNVDVDVIEAAKKATLLHRGTGVDEKTSISLTGSEGSEILSFGAGSTNRQIAEAINRVSDSTGVIAYVEGEASRGSVTLSSVGAHNDVVITANENGYDAGNYTFRVVKGAVNDAYIVSDPTLNKAGVIEISLEQSFSKTHQNFAGLFDVTFAVDSASTATSISITRGAKNSVSYTDEASVAAGVTKNGTQVRVENAGLDGHMSNLNGWTFTMVDAADSNAGKFDDNAKIAYIFDATNSLDRAVARITGATIDHTKQTDSDELDTSKVETNVVGSLATGDSFTFAGGSEAGELVITYKEGATADDIIKLINANSGVQATLVQGVSGDKLISDIIPGSSRVSADTALLNDTTSSVTASEMVSLINSKLGDMFTASLVKGDLGSGYVTYQDAAVDYGSVNSDNAIRFTGMDSGPIVRLIASEANQKLSVNLKNPTEADLAMGITTKVLEVNLATDSDGNSITTAQELVDFFNTLRPEQTGGISASLLLPDGVDINGRVWTEDVCGDETVSEVCEPVYGTGIVLPTGEPGPCEIQENDLVLLGANQTLIATQATAYIKNATPATAVGAAANISSVTANSIATTDSNTESVYVSATDGSWNGVKFRVDLDATGNTAAAGEISWDNTNSEVVLKMSTESNSESTFTQLLALINNNKTAIEGYLGLAAGSLTGTVSLTDAAGATVITDIADTLADSTIATGTQFTMGSGRSGVTAGEPYNGIALVGTGSSVDNAGNPLKIETTQKTSLLNGITIDFQIDTNGVLTNAADAADYTKSVSFDSATGKLTVLLYENTTTPANSSTGANALTAINAFLAVAANASELAAYNGSTHTPATAVTLASADLGNIAATSISDLDGVRVTMNGGIEQGSVIGSYASTGTYQVGGNAADTISITTDRATSALNGVSFNFTADPATAGFDKETGALTVYLNPVTQGITDTNEIQIEIEQAINGALLSNWEGIRQFTGTFESATHVNVELGSALVTAGTLIANLPSGSTDLKIPSSDPNDAGVFTTGAVRGVGVDDPAMLIKSIVTGSQMSGIQIVFEQDDSLQASSDLKAHVTTNLTTNSDGSRTLTIKANASALQNGTTGGINAQVLAEALNADENFKKNFVAEAPIVNNNPTATRTTATVSFGTGTLSCSQTVGGWDIETANNDGSTNCAGTATSSGISMTGNNDDNQQLVIQAKDYGSSNYVQVDVIEGSFSTYCPLGIEMSYLAGTDAQVNVNGQRASTDGYNVSVSNSGLQLSFTLADGMPTGTSTGFSITGGGAIIQLGPDVVSSQQVRIGIPNVSSSTLGGPSGKLYQLKTGGDAELAVNTKLADKIVQEAISSITITRGRIGAIQKSTLEPNQAVLEDTVEALTSAEAIISNADFAEESAALTRAQILVQSGMQTLGIANQLPQYAAQLIG